MTKRERQDRRDDDDVMGSRGERRVRQDRHDEASEYMKIEGVDGESNITTSVEVVDYLQGDTNDQGWFVPELDSDQSAMVVDAADGIDRDRFDDLDNDDGLE